MAFDRNKLEQQALRALSRGQDDRALEAYARILRHDPRDRRIRQKVADLYRKMGKEREAEKQYRELADLHLQDGNTRAAISVLKQLRRMCPQDAGLLASLARAYREGGFPKEAAAYYEEAIQRLAGTHTEEAADLAGELVQLRPDDVPLRLRQADLYLQANRPEKALEVWRELIHRLRRLGRLDEIGRVAELAMQVAPEDPELVLDAAEAALAVGDPEGAAARLRAARERMGAEPRLLALLLDALERAGDREEARQAALELAAAWRARRRHRKWLAALERARRLGAEVGRELELARALAEAHETRLIDLPSAQPADESTLRQAVRAEVLIRHGLADRAVEELRAALEAGAGSEVPLLARLFEGLVALGRGDEAIEAGERLEALLPPDEVDRLHLRLAVVRGDDVERLVRDRLASAGAPAEAEPASGREAGEDDLLDDDLLDDDLLDDDLLDDDLLDDDLLDRDAEVDRPSAEEGGGPPGRDGPPSPVEAAPPSPVEAAELPPPSAAGQAAAVGRVGTALLSGDLDEDDDEPTDPGTADEEDRIFAALLAGEDAAADPPPAAAPAGPSPPAARAGPSPPAPTVASADPVEVLLELGLPDAALRRLPARSRDLSTAVRRARALRLRGDLDEAMEEIQLRVMRASENDPAWPEAMFLLVGLTARIGRARSALRLLDELADVAPRWRPDVVAAARSVLEGLD